MSETPKTDREEFLGIHAEYKESYVDVEVCRNIERAGNLLHARLEHWISMNSGVCDPKDVEAIEAWKKATE